MAQRFSRQQDEGGTFLAKGVAMQRIAKMDGIVRIDGPFNPDSAVEICYGGGWAFTDTRLPEELAPAAGE